MRKTSESDLPNDLLEEILSRVPLTSLRRIRSTCKKWNIISKNESFTTKHLAQAETKLTREKEILTIVMIDYTLCLMNINLNDLEPSIWPTGNIISLNDSDNLDITRLCYSEGLVLCTTEDSTRLVVWNPYSCQTRWIRIKRGDLCDHALGYEKRNSCRIHKIFRTFQPVFKKTVFQIYDLNSNHWRVLDGIVDWDVTLTKKKFLSLKGNAYWYATDKISGNDLGFLVCFDFTTESFGPRLPLPFVCYRERFVYLSSVREEQLAVLFMNYHTHEVEVWVTTKIEPNVVSWSKFFAVNSKSFTWFTDSCQKSFVIEEEKRVVVVCDKRYARNVAYIIGENGSFTQLDLGQFITDGNGRLHACSYVPSSVQIIDKPA